ncbi:MAG TPA: DNA topoisomerase VI subunit B [Candidatus Thermoplasmatota archaeon]|nr:DNA topoisomerase VI subunit B [Candidatus Thermoplasmatota archaeon]
MTPPAKPIAEELAKKQKEISVSEFFERNKHILGFDSAVRALITSVKEGVDNALDACEEAGILPEIAVQVRKVNPGDKGSDAIEYELVIEDNGPGIVKRQMGNIFARLLYGSRFHAIRQSRGQQGIGISAVVMYGQLTTGKAAVIASKIGDGHPVNVVHLKLDTRKNLPEILKEGVDSWPEKAHGTRVSVHLVGKYQRGPQSVFEYLRGTAIVNPHAKITFTEPDGSVTVFDRATDKLPIPTQEIKPHPEGIEMGQLLKMAKLSESKRLSAFLATDFTRVSAEKAKEICKVAAKKLGEKEDAFESMKPADLDVPHARALLETFREVKLQAPPTDCLSPIGEVLVKKGLKKEMGDVEFIATVTRPPAVYSGRPFQVEVGIAYGGSLPKDETVRVIRFANRVPLMYQKGACVSTISVESIDWRRYELEQRGGKGLPVGPAVVLVHVASVNVPFTSEAKEAIAEIDVIFNEIKLALQECGRKLGSHLRKRAKLVRMKEKEAIIRRIIPKIAEKSASILGRKVPDYEPVIARIMNNVMINDTIAYHAGHRRHTVEIVATNYTMTGKSFDLFSVVPHEVEVVDVTPPADEAKNGILRWRVKKLASTEKAKFSFVLKGLDASDFDETDLYVKGIDEELVIGAEAWKGEVETEVIERITITKSEEALAAEAAEAAAREADKAAEAAEDEDADGGKGAVTLLKVDARPKPGKGGSRAKPDAKKPRKGGK